MNEEKPLTLDESTMDNLLEGCQLISDDWRYLYVNDAVVQHAKCASKEDLIGFTMMEKFPGIDQSPLFKLLIECRDSGKSQFLLNEFDFPDGSKGYFELRIRKVPRGIFILSMDVTERQRAEKAKTDYMNALEELVFMTSHKVRHPVVNILGALDIFVNQEVDIDTKMNLATQLKKEVEGIDLYSRELTDFIHERKKSLEAN